MKFNKAIVEHYIIATLVAAVAIWQTGNHNIKHVAWAALVGVLAPVVHGAYNHFKTVANVPVTPTANVPVTPTK